MKQELVYMNEDELKSIDGGVAFIPFLIALGCSAVVGGAFGYGAHVGLQEKIDSKTK